MNKNMCNILSNKMSYKFTNKYDYYHLCCIQEDITNEIWQITSLIHPQASGIPLRV